MKKHSLVLFGFFILFGLYSHSQMAKPLEKRILLKSNLLSLVAGQPTFSLEKFLTKKVSIEVSFVKGQFNNFLFTDHYDYNGILIRTKLFPHDVEFGLLHPYGGFYLGNLKRNIKTQSRSTNNGWFGYPSRDFSSNSIRGGGTLGLAFFSKSKFIIDGQTSIGYGKYIHLDKSDPSTYGNGYLDMQLWLSFGYCF